MKRSTEIIILAAILVLGAGLRGLYLAEIVKQPDFANPGIDASYHDYWARALITGDWSKPKLYPDPMIESTPYFRAPGYPYFLALVYAVSGSSYLWARLAQMLLGLASVLLAFKLGKRWFGSGIGLVFAGLMAVYGGFIYFEGELLEPVLLVALALALVYALSLWAEKISFKRSLAVGLLLGLYALVRPNILPFGAVALAWAWWIVRGKQGPGAFKKAALGLILGTLLMVLPATVRNYLVADDLVLIASSGGINLYIGNNSLSDGFTACPPNMPRWTSHDYPRIVEDLSRQMGRPLKQSEASALFSKAAVKFMVDNPGRTLKLIIKKALLFWGPLEVGNEKEDELERKASRVLGRIPLTFPLVLSLAVLGAGMLIGEARSRAPKKEFGGIDLKRRRQVFVLIVLFIAVYFLGYLPFFVAGRFRVPIIPFLLLLSAVGLARVGGFLARKDFRSISYWAFLWLIAYGLALTNFAGYRANVAGWHYGEGTAWLTAGHEEKAIRHFRSAIRVNPEYADAYVNLGIALRNQGKTDEAIEAYREAIRIRPNIPEAHNYLAVALYFKGGYAEAWREVHLAEQYGATPHPDFLENLSRKMPEPEE
jgi:4-amino-4-deoxy-L-arabinose transferase-like glycosyltransferase